MKVYKYRSADKGIIERDLDSLANNLYWSPNFHGLNDPFETFIDFNAMIPDVTSFLGAVGLDYSDEEKKRFRENQDFIFSILRNNTGIYSLSTEYNNELLWAHYASSHCGYCIEYDLEKLLATSRQILKYFPVEYVDRPPAMLMADITGTNGDVTPLDMVERMAKYKSLSWGYEKEFRILTHGIGAQQYSSNSLVSVTFGVRADKTTINKVFEGMKNHSIQFYKMKQVQDTYLLERTPFRAVGK